MSAIVASDIKGTCLVCFAILLQFGAGLMLKHPGWAVNTTKIQRLLLPEVYVQHPIQQAIPSRHPRLSFWGSQASQQAKDVRVSC